MKKSIMIIVPHQDDEILMTAGVIRRAVLAGETVDVVMATNGDCGCPDRSAGTARLRESMRGLKLLGLSSEHFHILGYADTGMPKEQSFLHHLYTEADEDKVYPSSCAVQTYGLPEKAEYHMEQSGTHAGYSRRCFKQDLKAIIRQKLPGRIYTTSQYDTHGDHSALYHFVREILGELTEEAECGQPYEPEVYTAVVHSVAGDENWPKRGTAHFDCPRGFEEHSDLKWEERICVELPDEMKRCLGDQNLKYRALSVYETALEPGAVDFLQSFIKDEEIFWRV